MTNELSAAERTRRAKPEVLDALQRIQRRYPTGVPTQIVAAEANLPPKFCYRVLRQLDIDGLVCHDLTFSPTLLANPLKPYRTSRTWVTTDWYWILERSAVDDENRRELRRTHWPQIQRMAEKAGVEVRWPQRYGEPVEDAEHLEVGFDDLYRLLTHQAI